MAEEHDRWLKAAFGGNLNTADAKKSTAPATPLYDRADSPGGNDMPESPVQPLDGPQGKSPFDEELPAPKKPDPKIVRHEDDKVNLAGDTVDDFLQNAIDFFTAHFNHPEGGHTNIVFDTSPDFDNNDFCTRAGVTLDLKITRAVWGGGLPPSDDQRKAIQKAVQLIKEHEGRHAAAAIAVAEKIVAAMVGKKRNDVKRIMNNIGAMNDAAQADLDKHEGRLASTKGGTDVELGPV